MIFLLRTSGRLIQKVARLITQGGQVDLKGSSTDSKTCTQPTKIFLLHTSSDRAQRNPLHSKAVRQGLKTPSFDPKVAPKATRQDIKTTQLVPKAARQSSPPKASRHQLQRVPIFCLETIRLQNPATKKRCRMTAAFSINSFLFAFALQSSRGPGNEVFSLKSCTFTRRHWGKSNTVTLLRTVNPS